MSVTTVLDKPESNRLQTDAWYKSDRPCTDAH